MSEITIRVGASVDRSVATVFQSVRATAKQAHDAIAADSKRTDAMLRAGYRTNAKAFIEEEKTKQGAAEAFAREVLKYQHNASLQKQRMLVQEVRDFERAQQQKANAAKRAAKQATDAWKRNLSAAGGHVARGAFHLGTSVLRDLARGAGVNLDMGAHMAANTDMQRILTNVSNEGYMPGDARNGQRVSAETLSRESFKIGNATGTGANEVAEGFQTFVGKTGDLQTARAVMTDLGKIAKATGADFQDVVGAAAAINNQLTDSPDKAAAVARVMRTIAAEGKVGAIPMREMAQQMGKIAANAQRMEGGAEKNIGTFGAIAQSAKLMGGAGSSANAATSIGSLMATFRTAARVNEFRAAGVEINSKTDPTQMRSIEAIIVDSFKATQRKTFDQSQTELSKLFKSQQAAKAVGGFQTIFSRTYGQSKAATEQAKLEEAAAAVRKEFDRLSQTMGDKELNESFNAAMNTSASQAAQFNNAMQDVTKSIQSALLPVLQELAPDLVKFSKAVKGVLGGGSAASNDAADAASAAQASNKQMNEALTSHSVSGTDRAASVANEKALREKLAAHKAELEKDKADGVGFFERGAVVGTSAFKAGWGDFLGNLTSGEIGTTLDTLTPWGGIRAGIAAVKGGAEANTVVDEGHKNRVGTQEAQIRTESKALDDLSSSNKQVADQLQHGTLKVHIVRDDTKRGPKAHGPDSDSLAPTE